MKSIRRKRSVRLKATVSQRVTIRKVLLAFKRFALFYNRHQRGLSAADKRILRRFRAQMPQTDDLNLVILKGHLLLDEMLTSIIASFLPHVQFVGELDLNFDRKLKLARALSWD